MTAVKSIDKKGKVRYIGNLSDKQKADVDAGNATSGYGKTPVKSATKTPAVLTSNAAREHMNTIVKPALDEAKAGIDAQSVSLAQEKLQNNQVATEKAAGKLEEDVKRAKLEEIKQKALLIQKELQSGNVTEDATPAPTATPSTTPAPSTPPAPQTELQTEQATLDKANEEYYKKADEVSKTILKIQSGSVPFTSSEKAQIQGLQQQYQALIDQ